MSRVVARARRTAACLIAGGLSAAQGQTPMPAGAAAPIVREPYVDRVLESGPQPALDQMREPDTDGWTRNLRFEYALSGNRGPGAGSSRGVAVSGFIETPQHGTLSMQGSILDSRAEADASPLAPVSRRTSTWRIDQRALPLEGGWLADHEIGDIATGVPSLARGLSRIYLPSAPIAGAGGHWVRGDGVQLNASLGQPGLSSGFDINGFETGRGHVATAGGQARIAGDRQSGSRIDAAVQGIAARDVGDLGLRPGGTAQGTWAALSWEGSAPWGPGVNPGGATESLGLRPGGAAAQANVLRSSAPGARTVTGAWADAAWRSPLLQNSAGLYRLEPGLRWGTSQMPADLAGGYWRAQLPMRRWQLGWDLETSTTVSGAAGRSAFGSVYGRYQLDQRNALDGTFSARTGGGAGESLQLAWDHGSDWGQTRWRAGTAHGGNARTGFFGADHAWALSVPNVLQTSLGWQSTRADGTTLPVWTWGVLGTVSPAYGWTLDASVQGASGAGTRSMLANVSLQWQFARDWLMAARYTESHGRDPQRLQVVSALTAAAQAAVAPIPASRSLQLVLRYEIRAGTPPVPLGGSRSGGAGTVSGTVFLDEDRNGRREASEAGVPNVTVVLDGRFSTRTDAAGRYEFPWVSAGEHTVQVMPDNMPLPWSPVRTDAAKTQVLVRERTVEDFPLQRDR